MTHELKTWPSMFKAITEGKKKFEIKKDDRRFDVGDLLALREWNPDTGQYTGENHFAIVTFILRGEQWGIKKGFCIMSLA